MVLIDADDGRLARPLIVVEDGKPLMKQAHIDKLRKKEINFLHLLKLGLMEYLDVNEEDNVMIATKATDITHKTTHLEIDCMSILGVVAGVVPYPHHNQSSRNTF